MNELFLFDIEGCLSLGKGKALSLEPLSKIKDIISSNLNSGFALCTGRSQPFVEVFCQLLGITLPCVCENGAYLYDPLTDEVYINPLISRKRMLLIKGITSFLESNLDGEVNYKIEPGKDICVSLNPKVKNDKAIFLLYDEVVKVIDLGSFNVTHSASAVDITPVGIDKASGVQFLSSYIKVDFKDMIGVGDTKGDLPFLQLVGKSAAPANATEDVKKVVDFIAPSDEAYGALEIINKYIT